MCDCASPTIRHCRWVNAPAAGWDAGPQPREPEPARPAIPRANASHLTPPGVVSCPRQIWSPAIGAAVRSPGVSSLADGVPGLPDRVGVVVARVGENACVIEWRDTLSGETRREQHNNDEVRAWVRSRALERGLWMLVGGVLPALALAAMFYSEVVVGPIATWQLVDVGAGETVFIVLRKEWAAQCTAVQLGQSTRGAVMGVGRSPPPLRCRGDNVTSAGAISRHAYLIRESAGCPFGAEAENVCAGRRSGAQSSEAEGACENGARSWVHVAAGEWASLSIGDDGFLVSVPRLTEQPTFGPPDAQIHGEKGREREAWRCRGAAGASMSQQAAAAAAHAVDVLTLPVLLTAFIGALALVARAGVHLLCRCGLLYQR